ncbi:hypothetical protein PG993_013881 [Apiospora rasikravindrae]|uniref:Uncharacterized protein n=1 Tax=Apiospora rasikravindrae TaxID=990691 RepID=A0ABR1RSZ4_9PEZI
MCKQYVYLSLCPEHDCDSVVGKKGRNTYCQAARRGARRLASCDGGLEYVIISRLRGTVLCDESEGSLLSDDGSFSIWNTIENDDDEQGEEADGDMEALCFFANKKLKAEKLASAYDFDLALKQEIAAAAALSKEWRHAGDRRGQEEEVYLFVAGGRGDSAIEYEKVPESTRRKGQGSMSYYGFKSLDEKELMASRRRLQLQCAARGEVRENTRQKSDHSWYDSDTTTASTAVMTPSESEGSEDEVEMKDEFRHFEPNKELTGSETTSHTARDADHESEGEVEINNELHFELQLGFLYRNCVDRIDGHKDVKTTATNIKRGVLPEVESLATGERSLSTDEDNLHNDWNAGDEEK